MNTDEGTPKPSWVERQTVDLSGVRVTLSEPVAVGRSRGYFWFPNLWVLPNGDLLSTIVSTPDEHQSSWPYWVTWSRDGGLTWSEPAIAADGGQALLHLASGDSILLPYALRPRPGGVGNVGAPYNLFPAGERTFEYVPTGTIVTGWPRAGRLTIPGTDFASFGFNGQTLTLEDGTYLCTLYGRFEGEKGESLLAAESEDGVHWAIRSVIADKRCPVPGKGGPSESAICRLKDGRIMCVFRVESAMPFGQTWSSDEGRTWSPAVQMRGPFSVQPGLAAMTDGTLALSGGRPGLMLWLDLEGKGVEWKGVDMLAHHNACIPDEAIAHTSAYTEVVAVDDTHLLYMYDRIPNSWKRIPEDMDDTNSVWVTRVTVEKTGS